MFTSVYYVFISSYYMYIICVYTAGQCSHMFSNVYYMIGMWLSLLVEL